MAAVEKPADRTKHLRDPSKPEFSDKKISLRMVGGHGPPESSAVCNVPASLRSRFQIVAKRL
jgi:hypothetical protein